MNEAKAKDAKDVLWRRTDMGVERLLAAWSFQDEISAVSLMRERGYQEVRYHLV